MKLKPAHDLAKQRSETEVRWAMVIDLNKCMGCEVCSFVCRYTNKVPTNKWRRVVDGGIGGFPIRERVFLPISCMQCSNPPCAEVCPTKATYQRIDGIVNIEYERCVGCGACILACPYRARSIISDVVFPADLGLIDRNTPIDQHEHVGVSSKCNFCLPRIEAGLKKGLLPGVDPEASPMCITTCSANALHFGDINNDYSEVSRLIRDKECSRIMEELGTEPSIYYIFKRNEE